MGNMQEMRIVFPSPDKLLTPGVVLLLSLAVAGYIGLALAQNAILGVLALNPQAVIHGRIWQLVTYPFVNSPGSLVCNGLVLLFIGSAIEREWRTASFLWLWLTVSIGCGILWVLVSLIAGRSMIGFGASACGYGIIGTMGMLFRGRRYLVLFATLEAQHIAVGLVVIGIILGLSYPTNLIWVAGALVACVYVKVRWSVGTRAAMRPASRRSGGKGQFVDID